MLPHSLPCAQASCNQYDYTKLIPAMHVHMHVEELVVRLSHVLSALLH